MGSCLLEVFGVFRHLVKRGWGELTYNFDCLEFQKFGSPAEAISAGKSGDSQS